VPFARTAPLRREIEVALPRRPFAIEFWDGTSVPATEADAPTFRFLSPEALAHVIRARPAKAPHGEWHWHDCDLQFVYVLKGWALFEYEGVGKVRMKAGSCFYQPPRIRHRELEHSRDLEMIEIVSPAAFRTYSSAPPAARKSPARRSRG